MANGLVCEFGSLAGALTAEPEAQLRILGSTSQAVRHLGLIREAMLHALRPQKLSAPVLADSKALLDYLSIGMANLPSERLRVLFLNAQNRLVADETLSYGSVREAPIYPREIVRRCLEVGATALILAHNHPSGDPTPSRGDIAATRRLIDVCEALDVQLHDHLIIARSGWSSFRALGLL